MTRCWCGHEQRISSQYFDVPILEVEGAVVGHCRGIEGRLIIRGICDSEIQEGGDTGRR